MLSKLELGNLGTIPTSLTDPYDVSAQMMSISVFNQSP